MSAIDIYDDEDSQQCRECGCTDSRACLDPESPGGTCYWVKPDLCSRCAREFTREERTV